jgi:hypothetical protein
LLSCSLTPKIAQTSLELFRVPKSGTKQSGHALSLKSEAAMAINKPVGDNARKAQ